MDEKYDKETIRCPRIGGEVVFKYCRTSGDPFCRVIISCWAPRMDIGAFLAENYTPEDIQKGLKRPSDGGKLSRLIGTASKSNDPD